MSFIFIRILYTFESIFSIFMPDNMQSAALPFRQHTYEKKFSTEGESY